MNVKPMAKRAIVRILAQKGAVMVRQDGDHEVWKLGDFQCYVPKHKTVTVGVCRSIQDALAPELGKGWLQK
jgi:predicted RNA binding protein YcfA (HicA-like mRNA interferase family)